jgi:hypothetical protein
LHARARQPSGPSASLIWGSNRSKAGATHHEFGGSISKDEVIAAADEAELAMLFTGTRPFRH